MPCRSSSSLPRNASATRTPEKKQKQQHIPVLEHQLHRNEHARQHDRHEAQPLGRPEQLREELAGAVRPEHEPDEVRDDHQEHVHHTPPAAHTWRYHGSLPNCRRDGEWFNSGSEQRRIRNVPWLRGGGS